MRGKTCIAVLLALFLAGGISSCKGGHYSSKVSKLHSGMSRADVIAALGLPYGRDGSLMIYYDSPGTALAVDTNNPGCYWMLLEAEGILYSNEPVLYKVRDSSGGGCPAGVVLTIRRDQQQ